ncbi:MAG TPA: RagB/SusD family nutrient uptake outer membrane protein [Chitinophagaceae bacterium]
MRVKIFFFLPCFYMMFTSCKKFLDVKEPPTHVLTSSVFSNNETAISAVTGLYSEMSRLNLNIMNGGLTLYPALSADELYNTSPSIEYDAFHTNSLLSTTTIGLGRLWTQGYRNIFHANSIIEGLNNSISINDSVKARLLGEILVIRAMNYFFLTQLFGDVPLQLSTDYRKNSVMPRTNDTAVMNQVKADLVEAKDFLPNTWISDNRTRINKWAALALLARVHLYLGDWTAAESVSTLIIQSGQFSLVNNLNNVFLPASTETIWQLVRDNNNTAEGAHFIPASITMKPAFALTNNLLNGFAMNDQRKASWIKQNTISGQIYYYPYKYKVRASMPITEYYVVLRLAEQILIRAEARTQQNKIIEAQQDINMVRQRAGLGLTSANDQSSLLIAIANERQIELFAEFGHRWFDLKRTGRANAILSVLKAPNWQLTDLLYPMLEYDLETNPFLIQNPGYN